MLALAGRMPTVRWCPVVAQMLAQLLVQCDRGQLLFADLLRVARQLDALAIVAEAGPLLGQVGLVHI